MVHTCSTKWASTELPCVYRGAKESNTFFTLIKLVFMWRVTNYKIDDT